MTPVRRVAIVGAGMVGLSTAWFLQERGVAVDVFDSGSTGSGATLGNAGWVTPGLVEPLGSPAAARQGLVAALRPGSPVSVRSSSPGTAAFLGRMLLNSTPTVFHRGLSALSPLAAGAFESYGRLEQVDSLSRTPILAVFESISARDAFIRGHEHHPLTVSAVDADAAQDMVPQLSHAVAGAAVLDGQGYVDPYRFARKLAESVTARGGVVHGSTEITDIAECGEGVIVTANRLGRLNFDAAVVAAGATSGRLLRPHGVRTRVQPGRGYSFSTLAGRAPAMPVYVPEHRLACTPLDDKLRVVGVMEFARHDAPPSRRQFDAMVQASRRVFSGSPGVTDQWVGSRPCTVDGLPLLGPTRTAGVFAAVGHGMWGITLGPVSGALMAQAITGESVPELTPFDPTR